MISRVARLDGISPMNDELTKVIQAAAPIARLTRGGMAGGVLGFVAGHVLGPIWRSTLLKLAVLVTVVGAGAWIYSKTPTGQMTDEGAVGWLQASSPALMRFGASFVGGFFVAYFLRKFITWTLILAGVLGGLIYFGKKLGWIELDWDAMQAQVNHGVVWAKGQAETLQRVATGWLPSSASGAVGAWFGIRGGGEGVAKDAAPAEQPAA